MNNNWHVNPELYEISQSSLISLVNAGLPSSIPNILYHRGYTTPSAVLDYLRPSLFDFNSPFLFKDMEKIVRRLDKAQKTCEKVLIYGDYDVDGVTATALLYKALQKFGFNVLVHIPKRDDGYGLHKNIIEKAAQNGISVIITVDCGITACEEIELASDLGLEVIITDHHEPGEVLPQAYGILNAKVKDSGYPFRHLAGVGVAYKLVQALFVYYGFPFDLCGTEGDYLDLVALGTIADIVPLIGENRILVRYGLQLMEKTKHPGLRALLEECGLSGKKLKAGQISFIVAPRINAAGRMDTARLALNLFLEDNFEHALAIAKELTTENQRRQATERKILQEAEDILNQGPLPPVIVLSSPAWHHGVIGIVASRLVEKYHCPVFMISEEEDKAKGSARGIEGYNVIEELRKADALLLNYGGHKQAAGFTLLRENIDSLRQLLITNFLASGIVFKQCFKIDAQVSLDLVDFNLEQELAQMAPFGAENPAPLLLTENLTVKKVQTVGKEEDHLKVFLQCGNEYLEAIGFKRGNEYKEFSALEKIDMVYTLEVNEYFQEKKLQAVIKDYRPAGEDKAVDISSGLPDSSLESLAQTAATTEKEEQKKETQTKCKCLTREMLVEFYKHLKALSIHNNNNNNNIFSWQPDSAKPEQMEMIKVLEELGIVSWLGGTGPYLLKINSEKRNNLKNSLRFRTLSSK